MTNQNASCILLIIKKLSAYCRFLVNLGNVVLALIFYVQCWSLKRVFNNMEGWITQFAARSGSQPSLPIQTLPWTHCSIYNLLFLVAFGIQVLYCICLVSTWWRQCWTSQTKDWWRSNTLIQPTRSWSNQLIHNICNCAITFSIVLTNKLTS